MTADRSGLGLLGLVFCSVTVAVMLVACTVVIGHRDGDRVIGEPPARIAALR
jgi:hypothetical protein